MLAIMSYNFWLFLSCIMGHFVGYLMFSFRKTLPIEDTVEKKKEQ